MTAAAALGRYGVLATDTAQNLTHSDGSRTYGTTDGRLREVPGGFVVGSGDWPTLIVGFEALERVGVRDAEAARTAVQSDVEAARPSILKHLPGAKIDRTVFLALREAEDGVEVFGVRATGEAVSGGRSALLASWPPEFAPSAAQKMDGAVRGALARAGGPDDAVRAITEAARIVSQHAPTVSDTLELAVLRFDGAGFTSTTRRLDLCTTAPTT